MIHEVVLEHERHLRPLLGGDSGRILAREIDHGVEEHEVHLDPDHDAVRLHEELQIDVRTILGMKGVGGWSDAPQDDRQGGHQDRPEHPWGLRTGRGDARHRTPV